MFFHQQAPLPTPEPKNNGIIISVRLSEGTLLKLISIILTLLIGSSMVADAEIPSSSPDIPASVEAE